LSNDQETNAVAFASRRSGYARTVGKTRRRKTRLTLFFGALAAVAALAIPAGDVKAQPSPQFADFPARIYSGPVRGPDLSSHKDARTYRTRLRNGAKGGINFAGDHVLVTWGCGAQCLMGAVINARSGYVQFLPGTICCWLDAGEELNPIAFERGSNLLVLSGLVNEQEPKARRYYDFSDRSFRLIKTELLTASGGGADAGSGSGSGNGGGATAATAKLDICYYDGDGAQHDADWCKTGGDLSRAENLHLSAYCSSAVGATCELGNFGACRPGSRKYSSFVIFKHLSGRCPTTYIAAVAKARSDKPSPGTSSGTGSGDGSGGPANATGCQPGFEMVQGRCVKTRRGTPSAGVASRCNSRCDKNYDRCLARVRRNPDADETDYKPCSDAIDFCRGDCAIDRGECYTYADGSKVCP